MPSEFSSTESALWCSTCGRVFPSPSDMREPGACKQCSPTALVPGTPVTFALLAVLITVLALEFAFGGVSFPVLMRMGALDPERVREGEAWRLVSYSFLHRGLSHLLANCLGLLILGHGIERLLGSARMLTIYAAAVLGGGLLPTLVDARFAVGASGGIWGLMVAQVVLLVFGRGIMRAQQGSDAVWHLVLALLVNLPVSFLPGISWSVHLGGGLVGGAAALGLLRRLDRMESGSSPSLDRGVRRVSVALLIVLAGGFTQALLAGKPWTLGAPTHSVRMPVGESGLSVDVPRFADGEPSTTAQGGVWVLHSGSMWYDLAAIEIEVGTLTFGDDPGGTLPKLETLFVDPEGAVTLAEPAVHSWKGQQYLRAEWHLENGLLMESAIALVPADLIVRVDTFRRSKDELGFEGMAEKVALSARAGSQ